MNIKQKKGVFLLIIMPNLQNITRNMQSDPNFSKEISKTKKIEEVSWKG